MNDKQAANPVHQFMDDEARAIQLALDDLNNRALALQQRVLKHANVRYTTDMAVEEMQMCQAIDLWVTTAHVSIKTGTMQLAHALMLRTMTRLSNPTGGTTNGKS